MKLPQRPTQKSWKDQTEVEKLTQLDYWLNRHQYGDQGERSLIASQIRGAGLTSDEKKELELMRKRYGYAPISY